MCAHATGNVITFQLRGAASFGTLDVTGSTNSFQLQGSGFATQVSQTVDTGTVALTVGGVVIATTKYGDGATPSSIAEDLAAGTTSGSSGKRHRGQRQHVFKPKVATGAGTNYSYALQTTSYDSTDFSQPSFANPPPTGSLSGGADANSGGGQQTIYSYSIPSYVSCPCSTTGYDAAGNVVGYTDSVMGGWGFGYDTLNRLQSSSITSGTYTGLQIGWGYDPFGNRTSDTFGKRKLEPASTDQQLGILQRQQSDFVRQPRLCSVRCNRWSDGGQPEPVSVRRRRAHVRGKEPLHRCHDRLYLRRGWNAGIHGHDHNLGKL